MEAKLKILIVDDKTENLYSLRRVLAETGAEIIEARNGNDALIASLNHFFSLAILDVQMPEMDGYELAEHLRLEKKTQALPIIFVSAVYSSNYHVFKGYESGAVDFMIKPFNAKILLSKVNIFLELEQQRNELIESKAYIERQFYELRVSENRFESLVATIPDIVYRLDTEGRFTFVNDAIKKLGYQPEELIGNHFSTIIWPDDVDNVSLNTIKKSEAGLKESLKPLKLFDERRTGNRKTIGFEIRLSTQKGAKKLSGLLEPLGNESVIMDVNSVGLYCEQMNSKDTVHLGTVGVIRNISERKQMEEQLRKSNEELEEKVTQRTLELTKKNKTLLAEIELRKKAEKKIWNAKKEWEEIFEAVGHMAMILDSNHNIIAVNRASVDELGIPREEMIGKKCHNIFHQSDNSFIECAIKECLESRETSISEMEIEVLNKSFICSSTPVFDDTNTLKKLIHIWTNITQRKKLEKELLHAHKMEAIGTLAGGIAHDFNNILTALMGFSQLALKNAEKGSLMEEDLTDILNCGLRAKELVSQILAFARQSDEQFSKIHLDHIVKEVSKFIRSTIPSTIEIETKIKSSAIVFANATQMHQVLMNLCTNASHAMKVDGGLLRIILKDVLIDENQPELLRDIEPGSYVELSVADTGTGVPPHVIEKIFEPYFTTKALGEGTGMGLAVVQGIIKEIGGTIKVETKAGKGTTFTMLLPVATGEITDNKKKELFPEIGGSEHILFVDDEPSITKSVKRILEGAGYEVTVSTKPDEALRLFTGNPEGYDLVVTDLTMPKITGVSLIEQVLKIRPDIPVVLCTGYQKKELINGAIKNRLNAFIHKPIENEVFIRTIRKVLDAT